MPHCEALCALLRGVAESLPHQGLSRQIWPAFGGNLEDERKSRINDGVASVPCRKHLCPQCGQFREFPWALEMGSKSERKQSYAVVIPQRLLPQRKNRGQPPEGASMSKKEKFPLYLSPEKKAILERR